MRAPRREQDNGGQVTSTPEPVQDITRQPRKTFDCYCCGTPRHKAAECWYKYAISVIRRDIWLRHTQRVPVGPRRQDEDKSG